jgi:outer membrane murein-binding lipoprotein Lpp
MALMAAAVFLAAGCVGKSKYNALMSDYEALVSENEKMAKDLEACGRKKPPSPQRVRDGQK